MAMNSPQPQDPCTNSQIVAGIQTSGAPTGMMEITPATTPSSTGCGTPAIQSPKLVIAPCTTAVPSSP